MELEYDDLQSDTDGDSDDSDIQDMVVILVNGVKKMKFKRVQKQSNFQKRSSYVRCPFLYMRSYNVLKFDQILLID